MLIKITSFKSPRPDSCLQDPEFNKIKMVQGDTNQSDGKKLNNDSPLSIAGIAVDAAAFERQERIARDKCSTMLPLLMLLLRRKI